MWNYGMYIKSHFFLAANFPLLRKSIEKLTKEEKEKLLSQLNFDSKAIRKSFVILVAHTHNELIKIGTTTKALIMLFREYGIKELANQIKSSDTIPDMFLTVKDGNYWSFFNYELLETIIHSFCERTPLVGELNNYISEFRFYCKRRLSEVPRESLKLNSEEMDQQSIFYVKMDETFCIEETNLEMIKDIQCKLQVILKVETLQLVNVESGCIELTFRYFNKTRLFPLGETQKVDLTEIGIQWICCGKDKVLLKKTTPTTLTVLYDHMITQPSSAPATTAFSLRHSHTLLQPSTVPAITTYDPTSDHFLPKQQTPSSMSFFNPGILLS